MKVTYVVWSPLCGKGHLSAVRIDGSLEDVDFRRCPANIGSVATHWSRMGFAWACAGSCTFEVYSVSESLMLLNVRTVEYVQSR